MNCPMPSGNSCSRCCLGLCWGGRGWTTGRSSTGSCGSSAPGWAWRDMPERYGPWASLHTRFRRWAADGTFERMLQAAQANTDAAGEIEWLVSVDSTVVRAHQHAAGAGRTSPALGRSRGGLTSKMHLACDGSGRPLAFVLTGGNTNLATGPRHRPHHPGAVRPGPQPCPARQPRRPPAGLRQTGLQAPQRRGTVLQPPQAMRGIATRYDKTAQSYQAAVTLASLLMWA